MPAQSTRIMEGSFPPLVPSLFPLSCTRVLSLIIITACALAQPFHRCISRRHARGGRSHDSRGEGKGLTTRPCRPASCDRANHQGSKAHGNKQPQCTVVCKYWRPLPRRVPMVVSPQLEEGLGAVETARQPKAVVAWISVPEDDWPFLLLNTSSYHPRWSTRFHHDPTREQADKLRESALGAKRERERERKRERKR